jgi:hypothetical protein
VYVPAVDGVVPEIFLPETVPNVAPLTFVTVTAESDVTTNATLNAVLVLKDPIDDVVHTGAVLLTVIVNVRFVLPPDVAEMTHEYTFVPYLPVGTVPENVLPEIDPNTGEGYVTMAYVTGPVAVADNVMLNVPPTPYVPRAGFVTHVGAFAFPKKSDNLII